MQEAASAFSLTNRVALITGSGRGIGFEIARALGIAGATVLVNGRDRESLQDAVEKLSADGVSALPCPFDVTETATVDKVFTGIQQNHGGLDILVNNVGIRDRRFIDAFELDDVRTLLESHLIAAFDLARRAARQMKEKGQGRIINVTSIAGSMAREGDAAYSAAKAGLTGLMRAQAAEYGAHGITANAIAPGYIATETNAEMIEDEKTLAFLKSRTSLGRWGKPEEIGPAAVFLASDAASYVTGHVLTIDGGLSAHF